MAKITINAYSCDLKIFRAKLPPMTWGLIWLYLLYDLRIKIGIKIYIYPAKDRKIVFQKI